MKKQELSYDSMAHMNTINALKFQTFPYFLFRIFCFSRNCFTLFAIPVEYWNTGMANSVDPDQTALSAVWSESAQFAHVVRKIDVWNFSIITIATCLPMVQNFLQKTYYIKMYVGIKKT